MSKMDRAKQFAPFASLRGYEDEVRKKRFVAAEKRELTEEEMVALNENVSAIKKGDLVETEYYRAGGYEKMQGAITEIDFAMRFIRIVKTQISFDDLTYIRKIR